MKKGFLSKLLVLLIISALVISGCQGTGSTGKSTTEETKTGSPTEAPDSSLEHVELVWYSGVDHIRPDQDMVWSEINKYLKERINVTLDYHFFAMADYADRIPTVINAGQYMDILFMGARYDFVSHAQRGAFYPLEDLIDKYLPKTKAILPKGAWEAVTVDGHIYGVPPYKDLADRWSFLYNKTMTDKYNLKVPGPGEWSTFWDMIPLLYEAKAARDADEPELAKYPIMGVVNVVNRYYPYETLYSLAVANIPGIEAYEGQGSGETVFNLYATKEYREVCKTIKKLVDEGIFPYDAKNFDPDKALESAGKLLGSFAGGYIEIRPDMFVGRETGLTTSKLVVMTTNYVQSGMQSLSSQTKHPERALMFLELLNTDKTLANMVRFGLEGQHYLYNDEGRLDITISPRNGGVTNYMEYGYYYWYGWQFGNILAGDTPSFVSTKFPQLLKELNDNAIQDTNLGFVVDTAPIANEIAACANVIAEYDSDTYLRSGMVEDVDKAIDEFLAKLEANGAQKIIDEIQRQLNDWRASVGKPVKK